MERAFTEAETSDNWDGDTKVSFYVGYPTMLGSVVMKRQIILPSLLWISQRFTLVYLILILNLYSVSISFPLGKMIGTMQSKQTSFCQAGPVRLSVLLQVVQEGWNCVYPVRIGHTHLKQPYILREGIPPQCEHYQQSRPWASWTNWGPALPKAGPDCQCILTVHHILMECNHFANTRKATFGRRDVDFLKINLFFIKNIFNLFDIALLFTPCCYDL